MQSYSEAIIELTEQLVSIPSENPPGNRYRECVSLLRSILQNLGWDPEVIDVAACKRTPAEAAWDPPHLTRQWYLQIIDSHVRRTARDAEKTEVRAPPALRALLLSLLQGVTRAQEVRILAGG